jgi:hypothetical protein
MQHSAESIFVVEYLREYESIFETASTLESVDLGLLFDEKTRGRKSRETVPLTKPQDSRYWRFLLVHADN